MGEELLPCPFCGAHLAKPRAVQYPRMGLARIHPGDLDQGDCPIAGWGFYEHQIAAWNTRPNEERVTPASEGVDRARLERLVNALGKLSPIETRDTADYAELTFGSHQTQAMTMAPDDWNEVAEAYHAARQALSHPPAIDIAQERMREALRPFAACAFELDGSEYTPRAPDNDWAKFRLLTDHYRSARDAFLAAGGVFDPDDPFARPLPAAPSHDTDHAGGDV